MDYPYGDVTVEFNRLHLYSPCGYLRYNTIYRGWAAALSDNREKSNPPSTSSVEAVKYYFHTLGTAQNFWLVNFNSLKAG